MREISSESYLKKVVSPIEWNVEQCLFDTFNELAELNGFEKVDYDTFHSYYWDGYVGDIRHLVIKLFEWLGMDVKDSYGEEW